MLSSTLWRALTTPVTYILVAVLVGTAVMQVRYVNKALQRFDSTQVIPVQFVLFTLSVIIGSAILYRDFEKVTAENVGKFIGGCLLTFFGVWLITSGRDRHDDDEEEDENEEDAEERIRLADQEPTREENILQEGDRKFGSIRKIQNGAGNQDSPPDSRRSSKISFSDAASRPLTPRIHPNTSCPSARVPPSIASSDGAEETPLLNNPWRSSSDDLLTALHPGMTSITSSPVLPSEAQPPSTDSLKPSGPNRSSLQGNVHTHQNFQQSPAPPPLDQPVTPAAKHPIARMMPGPFLSPLSGGLSVVVADTLRRGVDLTGGKKFRRPRINLRRSTQGLLSRSNGASQDDLGTSPLKHVSTDELLVSKSLGTESGGEWSRITRARSLSNTLGDLFRGKRQRLESRDGGGDEEAGPSES
jgi:magnesium transporter